MNITSTSHTMSARPVPFSLAAQCILHVDSLFLEPHLDGGALRYRQVSLPVSHSGRTTDSDEETKSIDLLNLTPETDVEVQGTSVGKTDFLRIKVGELMEEKASQMECRHRVTFGGNRSGGNKPGDT